MLDDKSSSSSASSRDSRVGSSVRMALCEARLDVSYAPREKLVLVGESMLRIDLERRSVPEEFRSREVRTVEDVDAAE